MHLNFGKKKVSTYQFLAVLREGSEAYTLDGALLPITAVQVITDKQRSDAVPRAPAGFAHLAQPVNINPGESTRMFLVVQRAEGVRPDFFLTLQENLY